MGKSQPRWRLVVCGVVVASSGLVACGGGGGDDGDDGPPIEVGDCDGLGAVGEWQDITPPIELAEDEELAAFAFAVDPIHSGTVYFGTAYQKMWKTTDCGASWARSGVAPT